MNASNNFYVFENHNKRLEEGIIIAKGSGGNSFGNKVTHNKFLEGRKYKGS
jgi:hypothetical protein